MVVDSSLMVEFRSWLAARGRIRVEAVAVAVADKRTKSVSAVTSRSDEEGLSGGEERREKKRKR